MLPLLLLALAGCHGPWGIMPSNPLAGDTKADRIRYGRTPSEKVMELRDLAKDAQDLPPAEQEEIARALALELSQEDDPILRMELTRTLGRFSTPSVVGSLLESLSDPRVEVRLAACEALARQKNPSTVSALSRALAEDDDVDVRLAAAEALGSFQGVEAMVALAGTLDERDPALRTCSIESLQKVAQVDLGTDIAAWQQHVRSVAAAQQQQAPGLATRPPPPGSMPLGAAPPADTAPPGGTVPAGGTSPARADPWGAQPAGYSR